MIKATITGNNSFFNIENLMNCFKLSHYTLRKQDVCS